MGDLTGTWSTPGRHTVSSNIHQPNAVMSRRHQPRQATTTPTFSQSQSSTDRVRLNIHQQNKNRSQRHQPQHVTKTPSCRRRHLTTNPPNLQHLKQAHNGSPFPLPIGSDWIYSTDTWTTLARHLVDTCTTLDRHLLDTLTTLGRHLIDT